MKYAIYISKSGEVTGPFEIKDALSSAVSSKIDVGSGHGLLVASIADAYFWLVARYELELAAARKRDTAIRKLKRGRAL